MNNGGKTISAALWESRPEPITPFTLQIRIKLLLLIFRSLCQALAFVEIFAIFDYAVGEFLWSSVANDPECQACKWDSQTSTVPQNASFEPKFMFMR